MMKYTILHNGLSAIVSEPLSGTAVDLKAAKTLLEAAGLERSQDCDMRNVVAVAVLMHMSQDNAIFALDFYLKFREDWMHDMKNSWRAITFEELVYWTGAVVEAAT